MCVSAKSTNYLKSSKKSDPIIYLIVFLLCVLTFLLWIAPWKDVTIEWLLSRSNKQTQKTMPEGATPSPSPTPISLAPGDGIYNVAHPKGSGPRIRSVTFSPLDIQENKLLRIHVTLSSDSPVVQVFGSLQSDTQSTELIFTKTGQENTEETWSTELTVKDNLLYRYVLSVVAQNRNDETTVTVAPRS